MLPVKLVGGWSRIEGRKGSNKRIYTKRNWFTDYIVTLTPEKVTTIGGGFRPKKLMVHWKGSFFFDWITAQLNAVEDGINYNEAKWKRLVKGWYFWVKEGKPVRELSDWSRWVPTRIIERYYRRLEERTALIEEYSPQTYLP